MNDPKPIDTSIMDRALEALDREFPRKRPTVRVYLEVPLEWLDFDKCTCEPDSISGECEGVPFSDPVWDVDLDGLEYVGEPVEVCENDKEKAEDYLIELTRGY